jgi:hypothetical protein
MLAAKGFDLDPGQDPVEFCYARGWADGLPVVPPTEGRILRMLAGTARRPGKTAAWTVGSGGRAGQMTTCLRGGVDGPMGLGALRIPA